MNKCVCSYCFGTGEARSESHLQGAIVENERSSVMTLLSEMYLDEDMRKFPDIMNRLQEAYSILSHANGKQLTYQGTEYRICKESDHRVDTGTNPPFCHTCAQSEIDKSVEMNDRWNESLEMAKNCRLGLLYAAKRLEHYGYEAQSINAAKIGGIAYTDAVQKDCEHTYSHHCEKCGLNSELDGLCDSERNNVMKALREIDQLTEHDSPPNQVAAQTLAWLGEYSMQLDGWVVVWEPPINKMKVAKFFVSQADAVKFMNESLQPQHLFKAEVIRHPGQ